MGGKEQSYQAPGRSSYLWVALMTPRGGSLLASQGGNEASIRLSMQSSQCLAPREHSLSSDAGGGYSGSDGDAD